MFSYIKKSHISADCSNIYSITSKSFAFGKWNLYKFRRDTTNYNLRDFTKNSTAKSWMNEQITKQKNKLPTEKLSSLLKQEDKSKLKKLNPIFKPNKTQFNKFIRKSTIKKININEKKDYEDLAMRLFVQDHTAQVLENIRKFKENKIFNRKLHEVKEKKLAMKLESRKPENIIENFDQKFLNYQNYNDNTFQPNKSYNLIDFMPEGRVTIGKNLEEPNQLNTKLKYLDNQYVVNNKFIEYQNNKNQITNKRIDSMLSNKKNNESLQKYLNNDNNNLQIENNSGSGEGKISLSDTLNKSVNEISNENALLAENLSNYFSPHIELTQKVQQYELEVYNEYKKLDLYNKYQRGIVKFGDLSLEENLNYIKFNIKNSTELFKLYKEIINKDFTKYNNENIQIRPTIFSAILQKFAIGVKDETAAMTLLTDFEYKNLLRDIKNNLTLISDKNIVDNIWSIAKLHGRDRTFSPVFYQHFLNEILTEMISTRIDVLTFEAISFLTEGLNFLKVHTSRDTEQVVEKVEILNEKIYTRLLEICKKEELMFQFHPFNLAKILNYFYNQNLSIEKYQNLLDGLGQPLKKFIIDNNSALSDIIDNKELLTLVKAYSWGIFKNDVNSQRKEMYFKSSEDNGKFYIVDYEEKSTAVQKFEFKSEKGIEFYKDVLLHLTSPIFIKHSQLQIYHCSGFIYHYTNAQIYDENLVRKLSSTIIERLEKMEDFKLEDVLNFSYGMSKIYTKNIFPYFNHDVMNIIFPNLYEKSTSYKYQILNKFKNRLFEKNDTLNIQNLSILCYTSALMGYSDIDFYLPIYHNIILADKEFTHKNISRGLIPIKFTDLGYLMQSLSLLNYNDEYVLNYLLSKFLFFINKNIHTKNREEFEIRQNSKLNHFSFSQCLSSIVNLSSRKYYKSLPNWRLSLDKVKHYVMANFGEEDSHNSISALWYFTYFEYYDVEVFDKLFDIINRNKDKLRKYESIVLNQVTVTLYLKKEYIFSGFNKDFVSKLNEISKNFDLEKANVQKRISEKNKYQDKSFTERIVEIMKKNDGVLNSEGLGFTQNFNIANSYLVPIYFPKNQICILFYDHTERMKDKNVNGYNSLKEDIIYHLGYKIERIYANECDDIIEDEDKIFDLILRKIR